MNSTMLSGPIPADPVASPSPDATRALRVIAGALAFGAFTQSLFWNAGLGLDWLVWDVAMVVTTVLSLRRERLRPTAILVSVACVCFGIAIVLHNSRFTTAIALPSNLALLCVLPVIVGEDLRFDELGALPTRVLGKLGFVPHATFRTVLLPSTAISGLDVAGRGLVRRGLLGLLIGLPAAGLFALLLCADVGFASAMQSAENRLGTACTFGFYVLVTAIVYAFAHTLFAPRSPREDANPSSPAVPDAPYRLVEGASGEPRLSPLTFGIIVAQVAAVFGLFVGVHRDTEFGGHAVIHGRGGVTYSGHLHAGFYQLLLATMLAVGLVLVGHRLMRSRSEEQAPIPGGVALTIVESTLLVLTGLTLVSCAHRLRLYQEAYGATLQRVGVSFVGLVVFAVLLCTLGKSIFRSFRAFAGTTLVAVTTCALAASAFDADAYVARVNLDRAMRGKTLDVAYLSSLSSDACATLRHPRLQADAALRELLREAWSAEQAPRDLRSFRGPTRCPSE